MTKIICILFTSAVLLTGCKKSSAPVLSGTVTLDNTLYGTGPYYALGFSFTSAKKVSTLSSPLSAITINAYQSNFDKTFFNVDNFENSFFLYGNYSDESAARLSFINLTTFNVTQWNATGDGVKPNQIWLFRTNNSTCVKLRIISTIGEMRNNIPFVSCTFQWVHQPDGSSTFPAK